MKALALFSGGLDSLLSIKIIQQQGVEVIGLFFNTGFAGTNDRERDNYLNKAIKQVDAKLEIIDIRDQFIQDILFDPKYGYGKNFNPCIDCHGNMFKIASQVMLDEGADFLISGEVVGQRPMSQRVDALAQVVKLSQTEDIILRPLCAKLLEPTKPELEGWIDRQLLLDINGRGRSRQLELAKNYGIKNYESPAGGCLLTDEAFSNKIKDHIKHDKFDLEDIDTLKFGRHLRLSNNTKLIIGRDHEENLKLLDIDTQKYLKIDIKELKGPVVLISKNYHEDDIQDAIDLSVTYSKSEEGVVYPIALDNRVFNGTRRLSKSDAQKFFVR